MSIIKNSFKHFKKICKHKYYVGKYCFKYGMYWKGLMHDMSKFSPTEFIESAKYYQGDRSPIDACKEENGYSKAWLHHKGRNPHHYEYWQDNFDNGGEALKMPFNCLIEMFCDYLGAGHAYMGKNFTYQAEYEWWQKKKEKPLAMHPVVFNFIDYAISETKNLNKLPNKMDLWMRYQYYIVKYLNEGK